MLDDHDAQAVGALLSIYATYWVLDTYATALTHEFVVLVAVWMGIPGWYVADRAKHTHRATRFGRGGKRPTGFGYFVRKVFSPRLSAAGAVALVLIVGLSAFAVAATAGTGVEAVDEPVAEMVDGGPGAPNLSSDTTVQSRERSKDDGSDSPEAIGNHATVYIVDLAGGGAEFEDIVSTSIRYWNNEGMEYQDREIVFNLTDDRDSADILVLYQSNITEECLYQRASGCAPQWSWDGELTSAEIYVMAGFTRDQTMRTTLHEFGHVAGLGHDDDPQPIMSDVWRGNWCLRNEAEYVCS